jgi:predicted TPR repeat methyltransferase
MDASLVERMAATAPTFDSRPLRSARAEFKSGHAAEAEAACRALLARNPDDAGALHLLGEILLHVERATFAVPVLERAVALGAGPDALVTLGRALRETGDPEASERVLTEAVAAAPRSAKAHMHLGVTLLHRRRTAEAVEALERAARRQPAKAERHFWLANGLLDAGRDSAALASYRRALELDPRYRGRHVERGRALTYAGLRDAARRLYRWGLALNPEDPELAHLARALAGDAPARASDDYVVSHFDRFADSFDAVLVDKLDYRTPELIVAAAERALGSRRRGGLTVLDGGCGTGLCGPLLRPLAARLVGVDLSPGMLERAAERGCYDELRAAELTAELRAEPQSYDLISAADVLVYFGRLEELFQAMAAALRPGGIAVVSSEHRETASFELTASGRYAHSDAYLREAAAGAGMTVVQLEPCTLRTERGRPVAGRIAVLRA